jgi:Na+/H+ antiporter NhaC
MAALMSFLVLLPFMFMEWVNRQSLRATGKEEFPIPLFIFLFVYGLAFIFMVVTLVRSFRARKDGSTSSEPEAGNTMTKLLARPRQIETIVLILALPFLAALALALLGVELPGDPNGLDFFDTVLPLGTFALVLTATFISTTSIARTVRVQGRLLAQPVSLILVTLMLVLLPLGWGGFVIDQWPCFVGIPMCD